MYGALWRRTQKSRYRRSEMRFDSFCYARFLQLSRTFVLALISVALAVGLVAPAAAQQPKFAFRPATPISNIFIERFGSGFAPEVDLRPKIRQFGLPIRNQGNRGTCTVFATTFLIEYQKAGMSGSSGARVLSEEYLNWAGNKVSHESSDGGFFTKFIPGYETWGIAGAKQMTYRATYNPTHPVRPSKAAIASAQAMFPVKYPFVILKVWDNSKGMTRAELQRALAALRSGRPVATGIWWLSTFATVNVDGVPLLKDYPRSANSNPDPSKNPMFDGHSIDLVGFKQSPAFPGGGYFIFRNSFGRSFGDAGYGFVSFQYLRAYSNDAIAIAPPPWHPKRP
jgi:Papain family cysteine protease